MPSELLIFEAPLLRRGASYMLKCLWLCVCVCGSDFFEVTSNAKFSLISHLIWMKLWIMNLISILNKSYDTTCNLVPSFQVIFPSSQEYFYPVLDRRNQLSLSIKCRIYTLYTILRSYNLGAKFLVPRQLIPSSQEIL